MRKSIFIILFLLTNMISAQVGLTGALISISVGLQENTDMVITTTSNSATWSPSSIVNSGSVLKWTVSGAVQIPEQTTNTPIFDLSGNTGSVLIYLKSDTDFVGLTEFELNNLDITAIGNINLPDATVFSVKQNASLGEIALTGVPTAINLTLRGNNFSTLNLSSNTTAEFLYAYDNKLTDLNIDSNPLLKYLQVHNNNLPTSTLDYLVNTLDTNGIVGGDLKLEGQTGGSELSEASYDAYQSLKAKGWTITPATHPYAPPTNSMPILYDFHIKVSEDTKVYFTATGNVSALTSQGFMITGKTLDPTTPLTIDGDGLGGYFTVTTPFNYFDNNTIRLESGDSTVHDFTMEYITNNIAITEGGVRVRYVDGSVASSGNGTTEALAYKTLAEGVADMPSGGGGKLWVKAVAGGYGAEINITVPNNGDVNDPNIIEGYRLTPGDITSMYYTYGDGPLDATKMPLFDGGNRLANKLLSFDYRSYWVVRNIQFQNYRNAIYGKYTTGVEADNILGTDFGSTALNSDDGTAFSFANTQGVTSDYIRVKNSTFINGTVSNITIHGAHALVDNCKTYSNEASFDNDNDGPTDYYIRLNGSYGIVRNSLAHKDTPNGWGHAGHGIAFKSLAPSGVPIANEYNLVDNCEVVNIRGSYQVRHNASKYNVFKNSIARANVANRKSHPDYVYSAAIELFAGGSYNTFENITGYDLDAGIIWVNSAEEDRDNNIQNNTTIVNCSFDKMKWGMYGENQVAGVTSAPASNVIDHCTFTNTPYKMWIKLTQGFAFGTNWMRGNIFNDVGTTAEDREGSSAGWVYNYNMWFNSWTAGEGTNSITPPIDPNLVEANYTTTDYTVTDYLKPQATFTSIDVPRKTGVYYDAKGGERSDPTTLGAILHADEVSATPPADIYDYYVSASGTGVGTLADPYSYTDAKTKIGTMVAGETMAFKGGDKFYGQLDITNSGAVNNHITLTSYGTGKAIFQGSDSITSWTSEGNNIYSAIVATDVYQVFKDNVKLLNTRSAYLTITTDNSTTQFQSDDLIGYGTMDAGTAIMFTTTEWLYQISTVSSFNSTTGTVTLNSAPSKGFDVGTEFLVVNNRKELTTNTWSYDTTNNKLYVYSVGTPVGISATSNAEHGIRPIASYLTFENIEVSKFGGRGVFMQGSNITINNCLIKDNFTEGIVNYNAGEIITITNSEITGTNGGGISIACNNSVIEYNTVHSIGTYEDMSYKGVSNTSGMGVSGTGSSMSYNTLYNLGYNGIVPNGTYTTVQGNNISDFNSFLYDGAGIYTHSGSQDFVWVPSKAFGSVIQNNIIIGSDEIKKHPSFGIYMDDCTTDVDILNNTISKTATGIYLHNNKNIDASFNNLYENGVGVVLREEDNGDNNGGTNTNNGEMVGNTVSNNHIYLFDNAYGTGAIQLHSKYGNLGLYTGTNNTIHNDGHLHPMRVQLTAVWASSVREYTLADYQALTTNEVGSTQNTDIQDPFTISSYDTANTIPSPTSGTTGWAATNGSVSNPGGYITMTPTALSEGSKASQTTDYTSTTTGKTMLLEMDVKSASTLPVAWFLQNQSTPYTNTGKQQNIHPTASWQSFKFIWDATFTLPNVNAQLYALEDDAFDFDNVSLREVTLGTPPENSFLAYNETAIAKDVTLPAGTWITLDRGNYSGTINIQPYSSEILTLLPPTYTVSNTDGTADYSDLATLLATETLVAGDVVALKGGDVFNESVSITGKNGTAGNPITFTSYGTGQAVITGAKEITGWSQNGNIWSASTGSDIVYQAFKGGEKIQNAKGSTIYTITSITNGNTTLQCDALVDLPDNYTGTTIFLQNELWFISSAKVTGFTSGTGTLTIEVPNYTFGLGNGDEFWFYNSEADLTTLNDWTFSGSTFKIYSTSIPTGITGAMNNTRGIEVNASSYIVFDNINVNSFNDIGIVFNTSSNCSVINSTIEDNYNGGVASYGGEAYTNMTISNNTVSGIVKYGIQNTYANSNINDNTISNVGTVQTFTYKESWSSRGIDSGGNSTNILRNTLDNLGYLGIGFGGDYMNIKYNTITNYCNRITDGGAIYAYTGSTGGVWNSPNGQFTNIEYNTIVGNLGITDFDAGIYMDDCSTDVYIRNNTISNSSSGIYLHNTKDCEITDNILYGNKIGISLRQEPENGYSTAGKVSGQILSGNKVYTADKTAGFGALGYYSQYDDYTTYTGSNNIYYNDENLYPIATGIYQTQQMSLAEWQTLTSTETGTVSNTERKDVFTIASTDSSNYITNTDFSGGIGNWTVSGNGSIADGGGYLQVTTGVAGTGTVANTGSNIPTVTVGEYYLWTFDIKSTAHYQINLFPKAYGAPFGNLGYQPVHTTTGWTTEKYLLPVEVSTGLVKTEFYDTKSMGYDLDNITAYKVTRGADNVYSHFVSNNTSIATNESLPAGTWVTLDGDNYSGTINIQPYSSEILTLVEPDYFVSANGSGDGSSELTPMNFATAQTTITNTMVAGETMAFKGGDEFYGKLTINKSGTSGNHIAFTSYGTGKATITNKEVAGSFSQNGNLWSLSEADDVYQVWRNGSRLQNAKSTDYTITSKVNDTTFRSNDLIGHSDLVGATIHFKPNVYFLAFAKVTEFTPGTGEVVLDVSPQFGITVGKDFYIINDEEYLTGQDQWIYRNGVLKVYSTTTLDGIEFSTGLDEGVYLNNQSYVNVDNLIVEGFQPVGISASTVSDININNCEVYDTYKNGISSFGAGTRLSITNNIIKGQVQQGMWINEITYATIKNNTIENVGLPETYTHYSTYSSTGIRSGGDNGVLQGNTIKNIGYNGINFGGDNTIVKENYIQDFNMFLHDGAAIYTFSQDWISPTSQFASVTYNTIIGDAIGRNGDGVYLDDRTQDVTVKYNYIENAKAGVYIHNNRNADVQYNKIYKSKKGITIVEDDHILSGEVYGNVVSYNDIYLNGVPDYQTASAVNHNSYYNNTGLYAGDNNVWWNYNSLVSLFSITNNGGTRTAKTLSQYITDIGQETNSITNTETTTQTDLDFAVYNETGSNKTISLPDTDTWYDIRDNTPYTTDITLSAYSSKILYKSPPPPVLGPELITNGTFETATDWTVYTGSINTTIKVASLNCVGIPYKNMLAQFGVATIGKTYTASFEVKNYDSGEVEMIVGGTGTGQVISDNGVYTYSGITAVSEVLYFASRVDGNFTGDIDNVSLKEEL